MKRQRLLTTILVIPITLGTVLVAEGLLTYLGPRGWLNRVLLEFGLADSPVRLIHNYWGVMLSLVISGFPVHLPADAVVRDRHRSVAGAGGRDAGRAGARRGSGASCCHCWLPGLRSRWRWRSCRRFRCFPRPILLGAPAGPTRVISIAAYQAAFEQYRLFAGLGDRDDHGRRAGADRGGACWAPGPVVPRPRQHRQGLSAMHRSIGEQLWAFTVWAVVVFFVHQPAGDDRQRRGRIPSARAGSTPGCRRASRRNGIRWPGTSSSCRTSCW